MASNLRSRPIEGYITDNSGNILRRVDVVVKEETPVGAVVVDTVQSDDDGYFITKPIKNGVYDIYESGIRVLRAYHSSQPTVIQAFAASTDNIPANVPSFATFIDDPLTQDINNFRHYIQIEQNDDIAIFGNSFPLWPVNVTSGLSGHDFEKLKTVHAGISDTNSSQLTHTRFDVEYFTPLTQQNDIHRRIRWAGVPGVRVYADSKIVIPLDYYSIVPNHHYNKLTLTSGFFDWTAGLLTDIMETTVDTSITANVTFLDTISIGDIIMSEFRSGANTAPEKFWSIVTAKTEVSATETTLVSRMWKSSNTSHIAQGITSLNNINGGSGSGTTYGVVAITVYQAFFSGIQNIVASTGERFSVSENMYAQDKYVTYDLSGSASWRELYNYNKAS